MPPSPDPTPITACSTPPSTAGEPMTHTNTRSNNPMTTRTTKRHGMMLAAALSAATLGLGACGSDDDTTASPPPTDPPAEATAPADEVVEVTMVDYTFEGLPETVPAGTRLTVTNAAEAELHEVVVFRLPEDEDRTLTELTALGPDDLIAALGEPHSVLLAAPGGPEIPAVGDGTLAEPGRYALFCFIPTGADIDEYLDAAADPDQEGPPQVEGGPPHFVHGMYAEVTVTSE